MSIEVDLGRIATALEQIVGIQKSLLNGASATATTAAKPAKVTKAAPAAAEAAAPVIAEEDPFAASAAVTEEISLEVLSTLLKTHSEKFGTKTTIALIKKHGADQNTPRLNTIPMASYQACYDEAAADLKKIAAKKG